MRRMTWNGYATCRAWGSTLSADTGVATPGTGRGTMQQHVLVFYQALCPTADGPRHRPQTCTNLGTPMSLPPEQGLVHPHSFHRTEPRAVSVEQCFAPAPDLLVDRMPITAQFVGNVGDRAAETTDLGGRPPAGSSGQQPPFWKQCRGSVPQRSGITRLVGTGPAPFPPCETHRPCQRRGGGGGCPCLVVKPLGVGFLGFRVGSGVVGREFGF